MSNHIRVWVSRKSGHFRAQVRRFHKTIEITVGSEPWKKGELITLDEHRCILASCNYLVDKLEDILRWERDHPRPSERQRDNTNVS